MTRPSIALSILLASIASLARHTGASAQPLSLSDATNRALARSPDIGIQRESLHLSFQDFARAEGAYDPTVHLEARYRRHTDPINSIFSGAPPGSDAPEQTGFQGLAAVSLLSPTGGSLTFSTGLSRDRTDGLFTILSPSYSASIAVDARQPLLQNRAIDPVRRTVLVARAERDRSVATFRRSVLDTISQVEKTYWSVVAARRDMTVRRSAVNLAREQRTDSEARIEAGTVPESDLAQPTAEVQRRLGEMFAAEEAALRAERALKSLLLSDAGDPEWDLDLDPADPAETPVVSVDLAAALRQAQEHRPELSEAAAGVLRRDIELQAARDRLLPALDIVGSYARRGLAGTRNPNAVSFGNVPATAPESLDGGVTRTFGTLTENRFPDASIGLSLTLPIGNRSARADLASASAARRQAELVVTQVRTRVAVEVKNAVTALHTSAQRIEAARAGRQAAETQLAAERERYGVGLSTNFFVLTRQNDLSQAQVTENAALTDYRKALTDFYRATGTLLDERRIEIAFDQPSMRAN